MKHRKNRFERTRYLEDCQTSTDESKKSVSEEKLNSNSNVEFNTSR
jgi:hypothetical protein